MASVPFKMQPLSRNILTLVVIIVFVGEGQTFRGTRLDNDYCKFTVVFSISPNYLLVHFSRQIPNFESVLCIVVEGY